MKTLPKWIVFPELSRVVRLDGEIVVIADITGDAR